MIASLLLLPEFSFAIRWSRGVEKLFILFFRISFISLPLLILSFLGSKPFPAFSSSARNHPPATFRPHFNQKPMRCFLAFYMRLICSFHPISFLSLLFYKLYLYRSILSTAINFFLLFNYLYGRIVHQCFLIHRLFACGYPCEKAGFLLY